jgi:hypothetical protein
MRKLGVILFLNIFVISSFILIYNINTTPDLSSTRGNNFKTENADENENIPLTSDDSYEENDVFSTAIEIPMGYYPSMSCEDDDWFKFQVKTGDKFVINIYYDSYYGDLRLELYNYTGAPYLAFDNETISWTAEYDNFYYIRISNFAISNNYDLDIYTIFDKYEQNNDFWSAAEVNKGFHRGIWWDDDDWYKFFTNAAEHISVNIYYQLSDGDIDIEIYDQFNTYLWRSDNWDKDYESLSFTSTYTGYYYVRVYNKTNNIKNWYDIKILGQEITIFSDNFESTYLDPAKWSKSGEINYFHITTRDYSPFSSGVQSLWCGNESTGSYEKKIDGYSVSYKDSVIINDLDLRDYYFAELSFDFNFSSGVGEKITISARVVGDNFYNSPKYTDKILEIEGTSDTTFGWQNHTTDLSFFCGFEHVDLIFSFEADQFDYYGEGIKIDNVLIKGCKEYNLLGNSLGIRVGDEFYYYFPYINNYLWSEEIFGKNIFPYVHDTIKLEIFAIYDRGIYWDIVARFWEPWDDFDEIKGTDEIKYTIYKNPLNMKAGSDNFIPNNNIVQYLQCADNTDWFNNYNIEHWCDPYWNDYSIEYFYGDFRVRLMYMANGVLKGMEIDKIDVYWERVFEMWLGDPIDDDGDEDEEDEEKRAVPGYDLLIMISLISFISIITAIKMKKSRK